MIRFDILRHCLLHFNSLVRHKLQINLKSSVKNPGSRQFYEFQPAEPTYFFCSKCNGFCTKWHWVYGNIYVLLIGTTQPRQAVSISANDLMKMELCNEYYPFHVHFSQNDSWNGKNSSLDNIWTFYGILGIVRNRLHNRFHRKEISQKSKCDTIELNSEWIIKNISQTDGNAITSSRLILHDDDWCSYDNEYSECVKGVVSRSARISSHQYIPTKCTTIDLFTLAVFILVEHRLEFFKSGQQSRDDYQNIGRRKGFIDLVSPWRVAPYKSFRWIFHDGILKILFSHEPNDARQWSADKDGRKQTTIFHYAINLADGNFNSVPES